jgi:hypothetical protein
MFERDPFTLHCAYSMLCRGIGAAFGAGNCAYRELPSRYSQAQPYLALSCLHNLLAI